MGVRVRPQSVATTVAATLLLCLAPITTTFQASAQAAPLQTSSKSKPIPPPEDRIDINHAGIDELLKVPGMTHSWAGRIVRFRPYRTKQDLLDNGVLPSGVYYRIKDDIVAHHDKDQSSPHGPKSQESRKSSFDPD